jgi:hypothetical protein
MRRVRALGVGLILALPLLGPAVSGSASGTACAAERAGQPHAALVVDTGARTTTYCVELDSTSVNGLHLIQLAAAQYGLTYRLGFGGQAVCTLNGVGPSGGDCFGSYPEYWGYWHGNGSGGWTWAGSGAGSASIGQGDVDGWSWGSGDSGTTHPAPPAQRFTDVCVPPSSPTPTPTPTHTPSPRPTVSPSATSTPKPASPSHGASASVTTAPSSPRGSASPRAHPSPHTGSPTTPAAGPSGEPVVRAVAASGQVPTPGGPPFGALFAVGAVAFLGAGGWLIRRRRLREDRR